MRFEHLVEVNDPLMPLLTELTRAQLWRGLVLRAEDPVQFVLGLESAHITAREERGSVTELARELDFGSFRVHDRVRLSAPDRSEIQTAAGAGWPASRMAITIEEPSAGQLFLRFVYEPGEEGTAAPALDDVTRVLRERAYASADFDTVVRLRELAEQGRLG